MLLFTHDDRKKMTPHYCRQVRMGPKCATKNLVSEQMVVETDFLLSVSYDGVSKAEVKVPEDYKGL